MELHGRRKLNRANAEADVAGTRIWTDEFSGRARERLRTVLRGAADGANEYHKNMADVVDDMLRQQLGISIGSKPAYWEDLEAAVKHWPADDLPSLLEATMFVLRYCGVDAEGLAAIVNVILSEEGVAYEVIEGRMIEFDSREMHTEVVSPTLHLLAERAGWGDVEKAYQDALREVRTNPGNAITDAGTALQEALKALGCKGNALGPLIKDARTKGLLAPHDPTLSDAIAKIMDWVSADRSEKGDAHKASTATPDDAWFIVHVVGALILRLSGTPRT